MVRKIDCSMLDKFILLYYNSSLTVLFSIMENHNYSNENPPTRNASETAYGISYGGQGGKWNNLAKVQFFISRLLQGCSKFES